MLLQKKNKLYIYIFLTSLLLSCSSQKSQNITQNLINKPQNHQYIIVSNLISNLIEADKKLTPELIQNSDGSSFYRYSAKPNERKLTRKEVEYRILLGSDFYKKDRENIIQLFKVINEFKINNKLAYIENEADGLWIPSKDLIIISPSLVKMGSPAFLEVLRHEVIHVAQSCFNNSRKNFPKRIGLPLEFSQEINLNLSHNIYSENTEEVINIEREAFTYSKVDGAAIKLIRKFCK